MCRDSLERTLEHFRFEQKLKIDYNFGQISKLLKFPEQRFHEGYILKMKLVSLVFECNKYHTHICILFNIKII